MVLLFDPVKWQAAGRPGAGFGAFPEPRNARPGDLFGQVIGPDEVGAAVGVGSKAVKNWARESISLIESWRWEFETLGGPRAGLRAIGRKLLEPEAADQPIPGAGPGPWQWIELPPDASPLFSECVLLRDLPLSGSAATLGNIHPLARDRVDQAIGFAIVRPPLGNGRGPGRGWLFRQAWIPTRWGIESLPDWLRRG